MKESGIYSIINKLNNNIYIGSAINLRKRKRSHFYELNKNTHRNRHLQFAYNKYGFDNFDFGIVELTPKDNLLNCEQKWIDFFNPEYNIIRRADRKEFTKEHINNLSKSHIGNKHSEISKIKIGLASKGNKYRLGKKWTANERIGRKFNGGHKGKIGVLNHNFGKKRDSDIIKRCVATRLKNSKPKSICSCGYVVSAKGLCNKCYKKNYYNINK